MSPLWFKRHSADTHSELSKHSKRFVHWEEVETAATALTIPSSDHPLLPTATEAEQESIQWRLRSW